MRKEHKMIFTDKMKRLTGPEGEGASSWNKTVWGEWEEVERCSGA